MKYEYISKAVQKLKRKYGRTIPEIMERRDELLNRIEAIEELRRDLRVSLAKGSCKNISREEVHALIDEIYEDYGGLD